MVVTFHQLKQQTMETKMNKIIISLVALAALSTASLASGNRSWDLRDAPSIDGKYAAQNSVNNDQSGFAFAAPGSDTGSGLTAYERAMMNQETNSLSSHNK
jgi:hypothetical protein